MKKSLCIQGFILAVLVSFGLSGCNENKPEKTEPQEHVVVLKFKQPDYKNYILANYMEGEKNIVLTRSNKCGEPVGQSGYSPYWDLSDNWLLVDWKWFNFPYDAGLTLLTELTWDKLKSDDHYWDLTEPHLFQPVDKICYISIERLQEYLKTSYSKEILNLTPEVDCDAEFDCLCEVPDKMDNIWSVLQKDLSTVIQNGDLEKISGLN